MPEPPWKQRFRAPTLTQPVWAIDVPARLIYASNSSGAWQVWVWDQETGTHRRVTDHPTGVVAGAITPDGGHVVWFEDTGGDEIGRWLWAPFEGGDAEPLVTDVEPAWSAGLAFGPGGRLALGTANRQGFAVRLGAEGGTSTVVYASDQAASVGDLSRDGRLLVIDHAEHGDNLHPALRVLDGSTGERLADLWDGPGYGLEAGSFSPVPGDQRVAVVHERGGRRAAAIWDPERDSRVDLEVDLPGEVMVADWWPDASALLLVHTHGGRDELYRLRLDNGMLERIEHERGSISGAAVRPDGSVWYRWSSSALPPRVRALHDRTRTAPSDDLVLQPPGAPAPEGAAYSDWAFTNAPGDTVHGFLAAPPGVPPFPAVLLVHGGPHAHDEDRFSPEVQAWVDHGFVVGLVNYRGSTGYGKAWQEVLENDPGRPEVEDVVAGRRDLIARGIADPGRVVIAGASWGGYITLQTIGTVPDGWRAAVAVVPVADYVAAYEEESEPLQALDRSLFGGSPSEIPERFIERSPITHAHNVRTPLLLMVGENDTRCPLQQVLNYAARLDELGVPYELDRFEAGHGALVTDERIRQVEVNLGFVARHVPGVGGPQNDA